MKLKLFGLVILAAFAVSCSTTPKTIRFDQTCVTCIKSQRLGCSGDNCPSTFMVENDCLVTMIETGENIRMNEILGAELIKPQGGLQIAIAKINGSYFLTGEQFNNLWILTPGGKNLAQYISVPLPQAKSVSPVFELYNNALMYHADGLKGRFVYNEEEKKWKNIDETFPKAGE